MNRLYYGDNLKVLRGTLDPIADESVDLIYLDPPFNSQANYNVLFKGPTGEQSHAQIEAFEDTWHWADEAERAFDEVIRSRNTDASELLRALRVFLHENDMMAYLCMMAIRLIELHRVLKATGSLYLHCDPTASHYLKLVLDSIFGKERFRNEIIWLRSPPRGHAFTRFPSSHDVLLSYSRSEEFTWNSGTVFHEYDLDNLDEKTASKYTLTDESGRLYQLTSLLNPNPNRPHLTYEFLGVTRVWRWTKERMETAYDAGLIIQPSPGSVPRFKRYLDEQKGKPIGDVWVDIPPINSQAQERLGYPTQKPIALLERIVNASSNEGDVILDPFCGCGTAIHAAQKLKRAWIGIDITHLAISLIEKRLNDAFPGVKGTYEVHGTPKDIEGARALAARDKYQFQWWAVSLVNAVPFGGKKKGADSGIDGLIYFKPEGKATEKAVVSVKGGDNVNVAMVRDLAHVVDREKAKIGVFITLAESTGPMRTEAVKAGYYETIYGKYPKIQIMTIEDLFSGKQPNIPLVDSASFKKAAKEIEGGEQDKLPF
ncbi:MAG: DNA methyltransferase [Bryobacteraceae bacterium]|jgi:site-specific DNA-methyltransferase (adenine-specific)